MPLVETKFGRGVAIGLFVLGMLGLIALVLVPWKTQPVYSTVVLFSPALLSLAVALAIFPGGNVSNVEVERRDDGIAYWWRETPRSHVAFWAIAAAIGTGLSFGTDAVFEVSGMFGP